MTAEDKSYVMRKSTARLGNDLIYNVGTLLGCHTSQEVTEHSEIQSFPTTSHSAPQMDNTHTLKKATLLQLGLNLYQQIQNLTTRLMRKYQLLIFC